VPDAVFYLKVSPRGLAERNFRKNGMLDYWESGMDIQRSGDMFDCFVRYQRQMQRLFHAMQQTYGFEIVNANRSPQAISRELSVKIEHILGLQPARPEPILAAP
jgi:dTMP kinase